MIVSLSTLYPPRSSQTPLPPTFSLGPYPIVIHNSRCDPFFPRGIIAVDALIACAPDGRWWLRAEWRDGCSGSPKRSIRLQPEAGQEVRTVPFTPRGIKRYGAVGCCIDGWNANGLLNLLGNGGFTHLPGSPSFNRRLAIPLLVHDTPPYIQLYCLLLVQSIRGSL